MISSGSSPPSLFHPAAAPDPQAGNPFAQAWSQSFIDLAHEYHLELDSVADFAAAGVPWPFNWEAFVDMQEYLAKTKPLRCKACPEWAEEEEAEAEAWRKIPGSVGPAVESPMDFDAARRDLPAARGHE